MQGFVRISKYSGMREDLVQAGGGNSSFKISERKMVIKGSGIQLSDVDLNFGYTTVNPQTISKKFLECDNIDSISDDESKKIFEEAIIDGIRPSIETFLHSITGKYTLHTHPIVVNAVTCREDWKEILKKLFPGALLVKYATPGVELAKEYFKTFRGKLSEHEMADVIFLQNHGLVVSADSSEEVIKKTEEITLKLEEFLNVDYSSYHDLTKLWMKFPEKIVWKITDENVTSTVREMSEWETVFCPDTVVFLGKSFLNLENEISDSIIEKYTFNKGIPVIVKYKENLYAIADSVKKALEIQSILSFSAQVMKINKDSKCNLLNEEEQNKLLNWDAEKYRKTMR